MARASVAIKLCSAQAIAISIYQLLPVEIPKIAQKPTIKTPNISIVTALSAEVGPLRILYRHNIQENNSMKNARLKKGINSKS